MQTDEEAPPAVESATESGDSVAGESGATLPPDFPTRETYEPTGQETPAVGPTIGDYVRIFVGLLVVIVIIWGLSAAFKRFVLVRGLATSSDTLKVLYSLSLSPTRTLYMVRLAERVLLIGSSEGGLRTLAEITDPEEVSIVLRDLEYKGNFDLNPFRARLSSLMDEREPLAGLGEDLNLRQRNLKSALDRLKSSGRDEAE